MRSVMAAFGLCAFVLLAGCATTKPAQVAAASAPSADAVQAANDPDKKICKRVETTGSRLPTTECHTLEEWGIINKQGEDALQQDAVRGYSGSGGN